MKVVELTVSDHAGAFGPTRGFPILAFTAGELSSFIGNGVANGEDLRPFNVADLPCPPMSVMVRSSQDLFLLNRCSQEYSRKIGINLRLATLTCRNLPFRHNFDPYIVPGSTA